MKTVGFAIIFVVLASACVNFGSSEVVFSSSFEEIRDGNLPTDWFVLDQDKRPYTNNVDSGTWVNALVDDAFSGAKAMKVSSGSASNTLKSRAFPVKVPGNYIISFYYKPFNMNSPLDATTNSGSGAFAILHDSAAPVNELNFNSQTARSSDAGEFYGISLTDAGNGWKKLESRIKFTELPKNNDKIVLIFWINDPFENSYYLLDNITFSH